MLPPGLCVDTIGGRAYVGVIALSEQGISPVLPMFTWVNGLLRRFLGLSHHAVNVRTYVRPAGGGRAGIYFFTLDCSSALPTFGARALFNLPYRLASMRRQTSYEGTFRITSERRTLLGAEPSAEIEVEWEADGGASEADALGAFFAERYCLYCEAGPVLRTLAMPHGSDPPSLWRGTITHAPWPLQKVCPRIKRNSMLGSVGVDVALTQAARDGAVVAHFSPGVSAIEFFWEPLVSSAKLKAAD